MKLASVAENAPAHAITFDAAHTKGDREATVVVVCPVQGLPRVSDFLPLRWSSALSAQALSDALRPV